MNKKFSDIVITIIVISLITAFFGAAIWVAETPSDKPEIVFENQAAVCIGYRGHAQFSCVGK